MFRSLTIAAALGLAAISVAPAGATEAVKLYCASTNTSCQSWSCPTGYHAVFDNGFYDSGPWLVLCAPNK
jgi:hypothetical protein